MNEDLKEALYAVDPSSLNYQQWVEVGMALKHGGYGCELWDDWSRRDGNRYHASECLKKWRTFKGNSSEVTIKSIYKMAREAGWVPAGYKGHEIDWSDEIEQDEPYSPESATTQKTERAESKAIVLPDNYKELTGAQQLKVYLETLFEPDDYVAYVVKSWQREDGKYSPTGKGDYTRKAGELIKSLDRYADKLENTTGDWNESAGAWIRFNPCDGKGVSDVNATAYRYTLIESDEVSIEAQYKAYVDFNLPIAALVFSGTKSLHAIVKIDAENEKEYAQRVSYLYNFLSNKHFSVDTQNKNVMRLSRLPGATRNGNVQKLLATNIGAENWTVWRNSLEEIPEEDLPAITTLAEKFAHPEPLPEPLIDEVLREGHKMIIAGPSKAGKSFALMELSVALAQGGKWLGRFQCHKCKVLYINLEIDAPSADMRFRNIYEALQYSTDTQENPDINNIHVWNLRGHAQPLDKLAKQIITRAGMIPGIKAIIIDPIYKVITGDENSAADMSEFCNYFDRIGAQTGASMIYCHHHSKGAQGNKKSIDRASGSGVLTRDPDAILDLSEIDLTLLEGQEIAWGSEIGEDDRTAWRLTGSLREFRSFKPLNIWFDYPIHYVDTKGVLDKCFLEGDTRANLKQYSSPSKSDDRRKEIWDAYNELDHTEGVSISQLADQMGRTRKTVAKWLEEFPKHFTNYCGKWFTAEDLGRYLHDTKELD